MGEWAVSYRVAAPLAKLMMPSVARSGLTMNYHVSENSVLLLLSVALTLHLDRHSDFKTG